MIIGDPTRTIENLQGQVYRLRAELAAVTKERDELLKALKEILHGSNLDRDTFERERKVTSLVHDIDTIHVIAESALANLLRDDGR